MLRLGLQSCSYLIAVGIPYLMLTGHVSPIFYFPFLSLSLLLLMYFSGPLSAAGLGVFATLVGATSFVFTMEDMRHGVPLILLVQIAWLWFLFWISGRLVETKRLRVHRLQEEIEKLELKSADLQKRQEELEAAGNGLRERIARYTQLRSFTDDLAAGLQLKEIQGQIESSFRRFFGKENAIFTRLELFPAPNTPRQGDTLSEWIVEHRIPLLVPDAAADMRVPSRDGERPGSLISCPIERENLVVGTITIESSQVRVWKPEDLRFLADISNIISLSISNAVYYERVESLAVKDSLTGLFVRYRFDERSEEEFARARSGGVGLALLILDIDHFKQVNDRWGHPMGDQVLKGVAQIVMGQSRETDFCARYGGEEIAVLMPLTDVDKALPIAERIRRKVEDTPMGAQKIRVTISGGVAALQPSTWKMSEMIQAADQALYQAKKSGRNRIVAARP